MLFDLKKVDPSDAKFEDIPNSLLFSTFTRNNDPYRKKKSGTFIDQERCLIMPTISNLYIYTNPPPVGYGSPGPKVAESILRAEGYNRKEAGKEKEICGFEVNCGFWEDEKQNYPFNQITGNWHPGEAYLMLREFKVKYNAEIQRCAEMTLDYMLNKNATILTAGRQTWNPVQYSSSPSPTAYIDTINYLDRNEEGTNHSLFSLTQTLHSQKDYVVLPRFKPFYTRKRIYDKKRNQYYNKSLKKRIRQWVKIHGVVPSEKERIIFATTFCSYIKHGERGKLRRRAIASPNILLRAYLNIIEYFHLELCKLLPGTTISIGGDEKKQKIMKQVNTVAGSSRSYMFTATQDATKFNECMNADLFAMMHLVLFNKGMRDQTETEEILSKIFTEGNFLLSQKRITLGTGPNCINGDKTVHNNPEYTLENCPRFNAFTRQWISSLKNRFQDGYVRALPGMLMGMHNAAATTISYVAEGYRQDAGESLYKTLRSSDDSLSVISAENPRALVNAITAEYVSLKLLGINIAESKSYWINGILGEYNSWYIDGGFSAQYGTETSALRPQGSNPGDDFNTCALTTSSALSQLCINPIGAQMRLLISLSHTRRLWRIPKLVDSLDDLHIFLADGGISPWTAMNCGLDETTLRKTFSNTPEKLAYWKRCLNPNNPFTTEPSMEFTYNKEKGMMTQNVVETPRTVFHYAQRHNRTFRGEKSDIAKNNMKFASEAIDCIELANPAFRVITYQSTQACSDYILGALDVFLRTHHNDLNQEELTLVTEAINKITDTDEMDQEEEEEEEFFE